MSDDSDDPTRCDAVCLIADDYGDNEATMRCQRERGHLGPHRELFRQGRCLLLWNDEGRALDGLTLEQLIGMVTGPEELPE